MHGVLESIEYGTVKDRQLLVLITIFFHQASGLVTSRPLDEESPNILIHAETSENDSQKIGVRCLHANRASGPENEPTTSKR